MSCLYVVRCDFSDAESLAAWQEWYSGEKQDWLLSRPGFLAGQRFEAIRVTDGIRFLAAYALRSADALRTPEYTSGWGWGDWRPFIANWSRDVLSGIAAPDFLTPDDELLHAVFAGPHADRSAARAARPGLSWASATGLDGSVCAIGLGRRAAAGDGSGAALPEGVHEGIFRPASPARFSETARTSA